MFKVFNPIQSNLFKSGNKAHTDTHCTIYTAEIKPKIKPTEPNKTHIHLIQGNTKLRNNVYKMVKTMIFTFHKTQLGIMADSAESR